jgi:hypothetical protein
MPATGFAASPKAPTFCERHYGLVFVRLALMRAA